MREFVTLTVITAALVLGSALGEAKAQDTPIVDCKPSDADRLRKVVTRAFQLLRRNHSDNAYRNFFGSSPVIRESVDDILLRIHDGLQFLSAAAEGAVETYPGRNFTIACTVRQCGDNDAHIAPGSMKIEICPTFFGLEAQGRGHNHTQVGTIIHEASHAFIGGTAHYAETYQSARELAISSPYRAMANPDSYAYLIQEDL
jgi:hypothetical protein